MFEKSKNTDLPETVDEVADLLISDLMTADIEQMGQLEEDEFLILYREVAEILLDEFQIWTGNEALLRSCIDAIGEDEGRGLDPAYIILKRVRGKLQDAVAGIYIIT